MTYRETITAIAAFCLCGILLACDEGTPMGPGEDPGEYSGQLTYRIIREFPHDSDAFTQGLVLDDGDLFEGTGLNGQSSLRRVVLETGAVQQKVSLPSQFFGEGITVWQNRIIQLTWLSNTGFVYDRETFEKIDEFNYATEGWGITHDGVNLIMSDGTATLRFLDPESFTVVRQVVVRDGEEPVRLLNELEFIAGQIFANVWRSDLIAIIAPADGRVVGWLDLSDILDPADVTGRIDVLNGIAYNAESGRLLVTGKLWPKLFEIEIVRAASLRDFAVAASKEVVYFP